MKCGETGVVIIEHDIDTNIVDDIIFTLSSNAGRVNKHLSREEIVLKPNFKIVIPLTQEDTLLLGKPKDNVIVRVEGQINFKNKTVAKTDTEQFTLYSTLATDIVSGNNGAETQWNDVSIRVHSGVIEAAVNVSDEQIEEIILQHPEMKGDPGADGVGIVDIAKTNTSGLVDTYTITLTDGTTKTFLVKNGVDGSGGGEMETMTYEEIMNRLNGGGN